jgi:hypothetical protein
MWAADFDLIAAKIRQCSAFAVTQQSDFFVHFHDSCANTRIGCESPNSLNGRVYQLLL